MGTLADDFDYKGPNTPESLRAEANRLDSEIAASRKGTVWISQYSGMAVIHDGGTVDQSIVANFREATEAEVTALCVVPEFKAYLDKVRVESK